MKRIHFFFAILAVLFTACSPAATSAPVDEGTTADAPVVTAPPTQADAQPSGPLTLTSPAFENEGQIPVQYGEVNFTQEMDGSYFVCTNAAEALNLSPALAWTNLPVGTGSLALLMWDQMSYAYPDMPEEAIFAHWVLYNLPPTTAGLEEGQSAESALQGMNNYPAPYHSGYGGPCPGAETHQYVFTLYALDTMLDLPEGTDLQTVLAAMEGHILAQAELTGYYTGE